MGELGSFTSPSSVSVPLEYGLPLALPLSLDLLRLLCRLLAEPETLSPTLALPRPLSVSLHTRLLHEHSFPTLNKCWKNT